MSPVHQVQQEALVSLAAREAKAVAAVRVAKGPRRVLAALADQVAPAARVANLATGLIIC